MSSVCTPCSRMRPAGFWQRTLTRGTGWPIPPLPKQLAATLAQRLFVNKAGLPSPVLAAMKRIAALQNPEFHKKQNIRLSTALTPRVMACAEDFPEHVALPRGCVDDANALFQSLGVTFERVLSEVKARYVTGLTATPKRRDGRHPIFEMQLGRPRFVIDPRSLPAGQSFQHRLILRETAFGHFRAFCGLRGM